MRYEVVVQTLLTFHTQQPPYPIDHLLVADTVAIEFEGRRFVWHALPPGEGGEEYWPTVTPAVADAGGYEPERLAMERFLSAVAYAYSQAINVFTWGAAPGRGEFGTPFLK